MNVELLGPLVGWPLMLLAAWGAGEWLFRHHGFPRVSAYGAVGLLLSGIGLSQGVAPQAALGFLANTALALTLFELGYRVNPRWRMDRSDSVSSTMSRNAGARTHCSTGT